MINERRGLPDQLWLGQMRPSELRFEPVRRDGLRMHRLKPHGGFWTSTLDAVGESAWTRWCVSQWPSWLEGMSRWRLVPYPTARIAVVESERDLASLLFEYGMPDEHNCAVLDFERLADDGYDGLHLTADGFSACRFTMEEVGFYAWDVESTVFFRWAFTEVAGVVPGRMRRALAAATKEG